MPPVNDNVANAIVITGGTQTISGDSTGANSETPEELAWNGADVATVWYRWTNAGASPVTIQLSTATIGGGNWPNGIEVDAYWTFTGTATNWADLDANQYDFDWDAWIDDTPPTNSEATRVVPAGKTVYISVRDNNWTPSGYGPFTFKFTLYEDFTGNDNFANAHLLTTLVGAGTGNNTSATSDGANDPLDVLLNYGSHTVWFKLPTSTSYRLVTYEIKNFNTWTARMAIFKGSTLATLTIDGDGVVYQVNNGAVVDILIGPGNDYYFELTGNLNSDYGAYTFLWTIVELPPAPAMDAPGPGIELKSPGANFTAFPGNSIAVRASSYPGGVRGTLATVNDSTSPSLTYLKETQVITGVTYATFFNNYSGSVADTLVVDLLDIGCLNNINYQVHALCRVVGDPTSNLGKTSMNFHQRFDARIYSKLDLGFYSQGGVLNNLDHQWTYYYINTVLIPNYSPPPPAGSSTFTMRCFGYNTVGVEIQIAQLIFVPVGANTSNVLDLNGGDFGGYYYFASAFPDYYTRPADTFADDLGTLTNDSRIGYDEVTYGAGEWQARRNTDIDMEHDYVDYQDVDINDAEPTVGSVVPANWKEYWNSHLFSMASSVWFPAKTHCDETFNRTLPAVAFYHIYNDTSDPTFGEYRQGFGRTTFGYVWAAIALWSNNSEGHYWGYNGAYGAAQKSWIEVDGSSAVIVCGGYDTGLRGIRAELGNSVAAGINLTLETPPILRDMVDYVIEGIFSTVGTLDSDTVAEIGKIGKMRYQGGEDCVALILEWQPDGSLETRLVVESPNYVGSNYTVDGPNVFDAGVYTGAKIHMKIARQRYVLKGKVWYDGDAEPGWQLEGKMPGFTYVGFSPPYTWRDYPYAAVVGAHYKSSGWQSQYYDNGDPFFSSSVAVESVVATDNGGQYNSVAFKWDNFKVSYDPDGDVTKSAHLMIKNGATAWVTDTVIPPERQGYFYLGRRPWLPPGVTYYTWLSAGAAKLMGSTSQNSHMQKVKNLVVAITGNISMRWKQGRS